MITIMHYLGVSVILFALGIIGIAVNKKSIINILMSIELLLLSANINFIAFSAFLEEIVGQIFVLFILVIAAAEAAIGLAIMVVYFRHNGNISISSVNKLWG